MKLVAVDFRLNEELFIWHELPNSDIDPIFVKNGIFWDVTPCGACKNRLTLYFFVAYITC
jgi:hypothetical protein